jgi:GT2 family glycosyltransferase
MARVRVVVVNYGGGEVTLRCIESLFATVSDAEVSITMVDNAAGDGVGDAVRQRYPSVDVITPARNEGFARGCNLAMADLTGVDAVALVNNDAVVEPGWLDPLLDRLDDPKVGAASPKIVLNHWAAAVAVDAPASSTVHVERVEVDSADVTHLVRFDERFEGSSTRRPGACLWWPVDPASPAPSVRLTLRAEIPCTVRVGDPRAPHEVSVGASSTVVDCVAGAPLRIINSAGGGLYSGWLGGDIGYLEPDTGQYDDARDVFAWCGGAVLLRADYLRDVGLFDPTFFVYYEDFDLSCRGRRRGWRYVYEPRSLVLHEHAWSTTAGSDLFRFWNDRNRRLALVKNAPWRVAVRAVLGAIRSGRPVLVSVLGALPHALVERMRINRRSTVRAADLETWMTAK